MQAPWFSRRGYKHFDSPVGEAFAQRLVEDDNIAVHSWSPLIHYIKRVKRYKPPNSNQLGTTVYKDRPIMYASHRDACILAKFAFDITIILDSFYEREGLSKNVIGYRRLGKSNYDFSADAFRFAKENMPCIVLCYDVTGFFDHLDHKILKERLKRMLGVTELPRAWYAVFRHVTRYSYVDREALTAHPEFGLKLKSQKHGPIASIAQVKSAGIAISSNGNKYGIPQGTPISSAFSNLYMIDIDMEMAAGCNVVGALYRRYSDDILIICGCDQEAEIQKMLLTATANHKLEIKDAKTERVVFNETNLKAFQYLGFNVNREGATIRPSSLARQWRKLKYSLKKTRKIATEAINKGLSDKVFTKRLRRRFQPVGIRNFSAYARRAGVAFGSKQISRQVARLERHAHAAILDLKGLNK